MTPKRYREFEPLARRLAWVCAGARRRKRSPFKADSKRAQADVKRHKEWWSPNIAGFGFGPKDPGAKPGRRVVVRFYVYQKVHASRVDPRHLVPRKLVFDELEMEVATDVVQLESIPVFHVDLPAGSEVAHFSGSLGTVTCYVRRRGATAPLLLSCAHVLAPFSSAVGDQVESPVDNKSQMADNPVGTLASGSIILRPGGTFSTDAALAMPVNVAPSNDIPGIGPIRSMPLAPIHIAGRPVEMRGAKTGSVVNGSITSDTLVTMKFLARGQTYQVENLLTYEIPAQEGDSGAAVMEQGTGNLFGLHVGAQKGTTHAFLAPAWVVAEQLAIDLL